MLDMLRKNGLAVADMFFQTAQDRVRPTGGAAAAAQEGEGLKAVAGEYVTTQHKPVKVEGRMKKWKEKRTMGTKNIKWGK